MWTKGNAGVTRRLHACPRRKCARCAHSVQLSVSRSLSEGPSWIMHSLLEETGVGVLLGSVLSWGIGAEGQIRWESFLLFLLPLLLGQTLRDWR